MAVVISGMNNGQWYQGTEPMWVQISLGPSQWLDGGEVMT
jgi:hypothetical protein